MSLERFEELVAEALDRLPGWVKDRLDNVAVVVEEGPPADDPHLLGLYEGVPLTARDNYFGVLPDRILLYQRPIEHWAREDGLDVFDVIYDTLLHEIGHHFGLDEEDLARLEGWEPDAG